MSVQLRNQKSLLSQGFNAQMLAGAGKLIQCGEGFWLGGWVSTVRVFLSEGAVLELWLTVRKLFWSSG